MGRSTNISGDLAISIGDSTNLVTTGAKKAIR
jgi:hypothetical protein